MTGGSFSCEIFIVTKTSASFQGGYNHATVVSLSPPVCYKGWLPPLLSGEENFFYKGSPWKTRLRRSGLRS